MAIPRVLKEEIRDEYRMDPASTPTLVGSLPDFRDSMHELQVQMYNCTQLRLYALQARRTGKTAAFARKAGALCISRPGAQVIYTARSLKNAKKIIFPELRELQQRYRVPIRFRRSNDDVTATFPGDSEITFMGIKTYDRLEDLRGFGKDVDLVGMDELGTYSDWLEEFVEKAAFPLTADCAGQMWLMGNVGKWMSGWWYEKTRDEATHSVPIFRGTGHQNPYLQNALEDGQFVGGVNLRFQRWLEAYREANQISEDDPTYRQEWLNKWCQNTDALVFDYDPARNGVPALPRLPGGLDPGLPSGVDWTGLDA